MTLKVYIGNTPVEKIFLGSLQLPKVSLGSHELVGGKLQANFVTGTYTKGGAAITFNDVFAFSRDSLAWLVSGATINEYAKNAPRITSAGLLIERQATNYARWSFLPQEAKFSHSAGVYFEPSVGLWKKSTSSSSSIYVNSLEALTGNVVASVCAASGIGNVAFGSVVFGNVFVYTERLLNTNVFYYARGSGVSTNHSGVGWDSVENVATSSAPMYFQIEKGKVPSSPIKTTTAPVTRLADVLSLKSNATSVTGDWDSTLNLSIVNGKLVHSGYGRIRSLEIK